MPPESTPSRDSHSSAPPPRFAEATKPAALDQARLLFREYAATLGFALDFQDFEEELATLPGEYAAPAGTIVLAFIGDELAGCVAFRPLAEPGVCEMKRMYVRPAFQGRGLGRRLGERILADAVAAGYCRMRLDTIDTMIPAITLYASLGFRPIPPYRHNPIAGARYFEAALEAS